MSRWLSGLPTEQVVYFTACELIYRRLLATKAPLEPLGKHFDVLAGYAFKSGDYDSSGVRLLRNINVKPDRIDWADEVCLPPDEAKAYERFQLAEGDLVLSMDGTVNKQGIKLAFLGKDDVPSLLLQRVCRLTATGKVTTRYLYHMLHSVDFLDHLDKSNRSIAIPHVSPTQLKSFPIPVPDLDLQGPVSAFLDAVKLGANGSDLPQLPSPLAEQRRVVARIEELAEQIQQACGLRRQADVEAEALLKGAIATVIGQAWPLTMLENAVDPERPITYGIVQAGDHIPDGVPYIRVSDMAKPQLTSIGMLRTSAEIATRYRRSAVREGDIVFAIRATIGKMRFVPKELDGANLTQGTARIAPSERALAAYLYWALQSRDVADSIQGATKGSTFKEITLGRLRTIEVPLPPIAEQRRIVANLEALQAQADALNRLQSETTNELDALLPAILDRVFKGELV